MTPEQGIAVKVMRQRLKIPESREDCFIIIRNDKHRRVTATTAPDGLSPECSMDGIAAGVEAGRGKVKVKVVMASGNCPSTSDANKQKAGKAPVVSRGFPLLN